MASTKRLDDCVKEFMLHRGLCTSVKAVENELKTEKDKSFRVIRHCYETRGVAGRSD